MREIADFVASGLAVEEDKTKPTDFSMLLLVRLFYAKQV
jgi:hypothetical protein